MADQRIIKYCGEGKDANLILSPLSGMWSNCPSVTAQPNLSAYEMFDDFVAFPVGDATSKWTLDATNGTAVLGTADVNGLGGVVVLNTSGTLAEDFAQIKVTSTDTGAPFMIVSNSGKKLWFEARVYVTSVTDDSIYVGLFNDAATEVGTDDTGAAHATTLIDGVYFRTKNATPTVINWAVAKTNTETAVLVAAGTLAATTWIRLGFYFDGVTSVVPYINGTAVSGVASTDITNFPDTVGLTPLIYIKEGAASAKALWCDYIRVVQER